ncbi:MAG: hypothetical protein IPH31_09835 [Lewinellaceae bacterium]|nr:hypothetical protein [Lewinellaceae bacterium]
MPNNDETHTIAAQRLGVRECLVTFGLISTNLCHIPEETSEVFENLRGLLRDMAKISLI